MSKATQQSQKTFEDLYNMLMERVEPELCTYNIDLLDTIYKSETSEEHKERMEHYALCLSFVVDALKELTDRAKNYFQEFDEELLKTLKEKFENEDKNTLNDIQNSLSDSD